MLKLIGKVTSSCAMAKAGDIKGGARARGHGRKGAVATTGSDSSVKDSQALAVLASKTGEERQPGHNSDATCGWVQR